MRATTRRFALGALVILATSGCRSSGGASGWSWNRKSAPPAGSVASNSGPALPSAGATPSNAYTTAPAGASNPYPDPGASHSHQATNQATPASYASTASPYPATGDSAPAAAATGAAPQVGRYNENFGQPATGAYAANPPEHYQPSAAGSYQPPNTDPAAQPPAHGYQGAPAYTNVAPDPDPRDRGGATPEGSYAVGDANARPAESAPQGPYNQSTDRYGNPTAQPEQTAADRYGTTTDATAATDAGGSRYQPGATGYNPGQTGYAPPGSQPYQMASQPNVVQPSQPSAPQQTRRDPYYRPGGTGDYVPSGGQTPPAAPGTPAGGGTIYR